MRKNMKWMIVLTVLLIPTVLCAAFDVDSVFETKLEAPILAVAADPDGDMLYVLTSGEVLIYSVEQKKVVDRVSVDKGIDGLTWQKEDRLILTAGNPPMLSILQVNQVFEIDVENRAVKGSPDAKATIVVFDDYQ